MALIYNPLKYDVSVQALGDWFTLKAGQIKDLNEAKAGFISSRKAYTGLVSLPEAFADLEYRATPEGKAALEEAKENGIKARCEHLRFIVHNDTVSLQGDLDKSNIKSNAKAFMSEGGVKALEELAAYKRAGADAEALKVKKIEELEALLEK